MNLTLTESLCSRETRQRFQGFVIFAMRTGMFYIALATFTTQLLLANHYGHTQTIDSIYVTVEMKGEDLKTLLKKIEKQTNLRFALVNEIANNFSGIYITEVEWSVKQILDHIITKGSPLTYVQIDDNYILIKRKDKVPPAAENQRSDFRPTMIKTFFEVTGIVKDASTQQPLPGVNIIVKGMTRGTTTDAKGRFAIEVEDNDILVFSFIGYKTKEIPLEGRIKIDITLEEDILSLKEVVVNAGYYQVRDIDRTGNISKVTADVIEKQPVTNPLGALQGRMPGVQIQQTSGVPGSDFRIEIRGRNSLRLNGNQPLYIVDGVPFSTEKVSSGNATSGAFGGLTQVEDAGSSPLTSINPLDIESIEILKDADATAIYGSRGANGVVLITTKRGKEGKTTFDLNMYTGIGRAPTVEMLNTRQYLAFRREALSNEGLTPSANPADPGYAPDLIVWDTTRYTNWQKVLIGTAQTTSIQSSIQGGNVSTNFLFSIGYRKENSVVPGDFGYQKSSFHFSSGHRSANNKFSINVTISGTMDSNNQVREDNTRLARTLPPNAPELYNKNGGLNWENSTWINPLARLQNEYKGKTNNFIGNSIIEYKIVDGLRFKTSFGLNYLQSTELTKSPSTMHDPARGFTSAEASVTSASGYTQSWIIEPQLTYERRIATGQLSLLVGSTFQEQQFERKADWHYGFPSNAVLDNLSAASITAKYEFLQSLYRYAAIYGRLNYKWKEKYILNLTGRRDGSSRFGSGKQFANFGAIGAAWIFSDENFVKDRFSFFNFGKLRASFGITGSDQIGNYQYLDTYATPASSFYNQYQSIVALNPTKLYNPDYAWEINKKGEVAIELSGLANRISLNLSYYINQSSNQLVNYTLPRTTGFTGVLANLPATVQNKGWEAEIATMIFSRPVEWTASFNITIPKNKLIEFPNIESSTYANTYVVGESIYIQKRLESTGVDPETGLYSFRDVNEDGVLSIPEDNTKVVFVGQEFYGGLNNSLNFKNFNLDIFIQFVKQTGHLAEQFPGAPINLTTGILNKKIWRQPGDIADVQKLTTENHTDASRASLNRRSSDAAIGDASFIRLKNISLSYQLPEQWIKGLNGKIYLQGQNLFTVTAYDDGDPETQFGSGFLPPLRMITVGIHLTL